MFPTKRGRMRTEDAGLDWRKATKPRAKWGRREERVLWGNHQAHLVLPRLRGSVSQQMSFQWLFPVLCPSGHLEVTGEGVVRGQWWWQWCRKPAGSPGRGGWMGMIQRPGFLPPPPQGGCLSFYLSIPALSHCATFQIELHVLGSPAVTLSHSLHY